MKTNRLTLAAFLFSATLSKVNAFCVNLEEGAETDDGCPKETPLCIARNGSTIELDEQGEQCAKCQNDQNQTDYNMSYPFDFGCDFNFPICADDHENELQDLGVYGSRCIASCVNSHEGPETDNGCPQETPLCIGKDGGSVKLDERGGQCAKCQNDHNQANYNMSFPFDFGCNFDFPICADDDENELQNLDEYGSRCIAIKCFHGGAPNGPDPGCNEFNGVCSYFDGLPVEEPYGIGNICLTSDCQDTTDGIGQDDGCGGNSDSLDEWFPICYYQGKQVTDSTRGNECRSPMCQDTADGQQQDEGCSATHPVCYHRGKQVMPQQEVTLNPGFGDECRKGQCKDTVEDVTMVDEGCDVEHPVCHDKKGKPIVDGSSGTECRFLCKDTEGDIGQDSGCDRENPVCFSDGEPVEDGGYGDQCRHVCQNTDTGEHVLGLDAGCNSTHPVCYADGVQVLTIGDLGNECRTPHCKNTDLTDIGLDEGCNNTHPLCAFNGQQVSNTAIPWGDDCIEPLCKNTADGLEQDQGCEDMPKTVCSYNGQPVKNEDENQFGNECIFACIGTGDLVQDEGCPANAPLCHLGSDDHQVTDGSLGNKCWPKCLQSGIGLAQDLGCTQENPVCFYNGVALVPGPQVIGTECRSVKCWDSAEGLGQDEGCNSTHTVCFFQGQPSSLNGGYGDECRSFTCWDTATGLEQDEGCDTTNPICSYDQDNPVTDGSFGNVCISQTCHNTATGMDQDNGCDAMNPICVNNDGQEPTTKNPYGDDCRKCRDSSDGNNKDDGCDDDHGVCFYNGQQVADGSFGNECRHVDLSGWSKFETTYSGTHVGEKGLDELPNGEQSWSWDLCAEACAAIPDCKYWTVNAEQDVCVLRKNRQQQLYGTNSVQGSTGGIDSDCSHVGVIAEWLDSIETDSQTCGTHVNTTKNTVDEVIAHLQKIQDIREKTMPMKNAYNSFKPHLPTLEKVVKLVPSVGAAMGKALKVAEKVGETVTTIDSKLQVLETKTDPTKERLTNTSTVLGEVSGNMTELGNKAGVVGFVVDTVRTCCINSNSDTDDAILETFAESQLDPVGGVQVASELCVTALQQVLDVLVLPKLDFLPKLLIDLEKIEAFFQAILDQLAAVAQAVGGALDQVTNAMCCISEDLTDLVNDAVDAVSTVINIGACLLDDLIDFSFLDALTSIIEIDIGWEAVYGSYKLPHIVWNGFGVDFQPGSFKGCTLPSYDVTVDAPRLYYMEYEYTILPSFSLKLGNDLTFECDLNLPDSGSCRDNVGCCEDSECSKFADTPICDTNFFTGSYECIPRKPVGESCTYDGTCESNNCFKPTGTGLAGTCQCHECSTPGCDVCATGQHCVNPGGFKANYCLVPRANDMFCSGDHECASGWCRGGRCHTVRSEGESCPTEENRECHDGGCYRSTRYGNYKCCRNTNFCDVWDPGCTTGFYYCSSSGLGR